MTTIAIYNPSWKTFGGGEKYCCALADTLATQPLTPVTLLVDRREIAKEQFQQYFNLSLQGVQVEYTPARDIPRRLAAADIAVIVSNFRPWGNYARRNVFIIQIPYPQITVHSILAKTLHGEVKEAAKDVMRRSLLRNARNADVALVYSEFTRDVLSQHHGIRADVLYPPIDDFGMEAGKQNVILSVGRFFSGLYNEKRYDVLIEAFKQLHRRLPGCTWQYRLVGSCGPDKASRRHLESLKESARNFPVEFYVNAPYADLRRHYNEASIFWHAAGFGVDDTIHPERTEHFGMSTVEAMSARCVPLVVRKGGQKEIVSHGESGYLWETVEELVSQSKVLMQDPALLRSIGERARMRYRDFDRAHFTKQCLSIFGRQGIDDPGGT